MIYGKEHSNAVVINVGKYYNSNSDTDIYGWLSKTVTVPNSISIIHESDISVIPYCANDDGSKVTLTSFCSITSAGNFYMEFSGNPSKDFTMSVSLITFDGITGTISGTVASAGENYSYFYAPIADTGFNFETYMGSSIIITFSPVPSGYTKAS